MHTAKKQQDNIAYFTRSELQGDVNEKYLSEYVDKKYYTNDYFLNFVKSIFRTENFLSFYKFYRFPNASSKLINSRIKEPLNRVFFSEDSYFSHIVRGEEIEDPFDHKFKEKLFHALLFSHNAIVIHDLDGTNNPFRKILSIDKVVSIDSEESVINRIAYSAVADVNGVEVLGYAYMDSEKYCFYNEDYEQLINEPHDLGFCPAHYVSKEAFSTDDVVRKSIFSYVREELEEYTFLKTLQRMIEPNGGIPITTVLDVKSKKPDGNNVAKTNATMSSGEISGQQPEFQKQTPESKSFLQTGTEIRVPLVKKPDGSIDTDFAKNLINFHYLPVESLEYLNKRIKQVEQSVIISVLGDYSEQNEEAKNELQVSKSYVSKEDVLRWVSQSLSRIHQLSNYTMLALQYGKENVEVDIFYGSDFFLETQETLYDLYSNAPNPIERRKILIRASQSANKFNKSKALRETILYKLLPYASDKDFNLVMGGLDPVTIEMQTRFSYWIAMFEATYGNVVTFWNDTETDEAQKLVLINNLLNQLITQNSKLNGTEKNRAS